MLKLYKIEMLRELPEKEEKIMTALEKDIMRHYCNAALDIMTGGEGVLSSTEIAAITGLPLSKVRKAIRSLSSQGFLKSGAVSWYDEDAFLPRTLRGYRITESARKTEVYREMAEKEKQIRKAIWGIDCDSLI